MSDAGTQITGMSPRRTEAAEPLVVNPPALPRAAAEWGLASLVLAGFLALAALLFLTLGLLYWVHFDQAHPGRGGGMLTVFLSGVVVLLLWGLSIASVFIGAVGLRSATTRQHPAGLPLAGVLLSAVVAVLWTCALIALLKEGIDVLDRL
jgi:hypothetical protein